VKRSEYLKAWDAEYRQQGRLWTGKQADVPRLQKGTMALELGCGDGKTLSALAKQECDLVGLDISPAALRITRAALTRDGKTAQLLQGDVTALPFEEEAFDTVVAYHVLDHVYQEDREAAAEEIARVLRPGGTLFFRGFSREDLRSKKGEQVEEATVLRGNGILYHYFKIDEVKGLFSGLEPQDVHVRKWKMGNKEALTRSFVLGTFRSPSVMENDL
jgi:ubiquinone/menaquinone biosynthesis C-methylase UbiE